MNLVCGLPCQINSIVVQEECPQRNEEKEMCGTSCRIPQVPNNDRTTEAKSFQVPFSVSKRRNRRSNASKEANVAATTKEFSVECIFVRNSWKLKHFSFSQNANRFCSNRREQPHKICPEQKAFCRFANENFTK